MSTRWRLAVNRALCIGAGSCAAVAPRHFALDITRRSTPLVELTDPDPAVLAAAEVCPVEAITIFSADDDRPVFPAE